MGSHIYTYIYIHSDWIAKWQRQLYVCHYIPVYHKQCCSHVWKILTNLHVSACETCPTLSDPVMPCLCSCNFAEGIPEPSLCMNFCWASWSAHFQCSWWKALATNVMMCGRLGAGDVVTGHTKQPTWNGRTSGTSWAWGTSRRCKSARLPILLNKSQSIANPSQYNWPKIPDFLYNYPHADITIYL